MFTILDGCMLLFEVSCQRDHHHDVDDGHDYAEFDAALLMVIMMLLMVVEIYARLCILPIFLGNVDFGKIAFCIYKLYRGYIL